MATETIPTIMQQQAQAAEVAPTNTQSATNKFTATDAASWLNLATPLSNAFSSIMNAIKGTNISDYEKEIAIQQEFYSLQQKQAAEQKQTYLIAGSLCLLAILLTVYFTRH